MLSINGFNTQNNTDSNDSIMQMLTAALETQVSSEDHARKSLGELSSLVKLFEDTLFNAPTANSANQQLCSIYREILQKSAEVDQTIDSSTTQETKRTFNALKVRANTCRQSVIEMQKEERELFINIFGSQPETYLGDTQCQQ